MFLDPDQGKQKRGGEEVDQESEGGEKVYLLKGRQVQDQGQENELRTGVTNKVKQGYQVLEEVVSEGQGQDQEATHIDTEAEHAHPSNIPGEGSLIAQKADVLTLDLCQDLHIGQENSQDPQVAHHITEDHLKHTQEDIS